MLRSSGALPTPFGVSAARSDESGYVLAAMKGAIGFTVRVLANIREGAGGMAPKGSQLTYGWVPGNS